MSYTREVRPWGAAPKRQDFAVLTLQKSSDGAQLIDFQGAQEINIEFNTACKAVMASSASEAATKVSSGDYKPFSDTKGGAFYADAENNLYIVNDTDLDVALALEASYYYYSH